MLLFNDVYLYPTNKVSSDALNLFEKTIKKFDDQGLVSKVRALNNEIFNQISELSLETLYVSYTSSNSIFYRFKMLNNSFEFKWELFLDCEEENNIESVLHVYKNSLKEKSTFGSIYYVYSIITDIIFNTNAELKYSFEPVEEYTSIVYPQKEYAGELSYAFDTY